MSNGGNTLGSLLSGLRRRHGLTLKEMSARCGIPLSTLAKVERDLLSLTYDKLVMISQSLNIRLSELLAEPNAPGPAGSGRRSVGTIEHSLRITTGNYEYFFLCSDLRVKQMIPVITRIRAKSLPEFGELLKHPGEEYVHVLQGRVVVHTEFYDPVVLHTGQGIYLDSMMGHAYTVDGDCTEALTLGVCSSAEPELASALRGTESHERHTPPTARRSATRSRSTPKKQTAP